ncbi:MAG TPA: zinc-dependent metalloprotease [Saprospiraceae bacterium]|nr:zinc-dependent metalloprotease [Saprospiraceae bacterium]
MNKHSKKYFALICIFWLGLTRAGKTQTRCDLGLDAPGRAAYSEWRASINTYKNIDLRTTMTIPVVVHIVYRTADENLSDRQIQSQIDALNRAYANPADTRSGVPKEFAELQSVPGVHFCLASMDPDGQMTNGITRTKTNFENIGLLFGDGQRRSIHYAILGGADAWDPDHYFNIWVGELGGLLGRATMPGTNLLFEEDGIVIAPEVFGTTGTVAYPFHQGKTAVHEAGHYLGLPHLWGMDAGDCTEDDGLADTPVQAGPYLGCPEYPQYSCGTSDLFNDYMDFTDDDCLLLFTHDQVQLMLATLTGYRKGLLESAGCSKHPGWSPTDQLVFVSYAAARRQLEVVWRHPGESVYDIRIWDVAGRLLVHQKGYGFTPWIVPVTSWVNGLYFVQIISAGNQTTQKVLIY